MTARILIVDDVPANTRLMEARLAAEYYESATAHDGEAAIVLARDWQPDILLLDVMMPGIDGFETCRRLKSDPLTQHIPVVMITTLEDSGERVRGLEAGADDFLSKPVDFPTLFARVRSLVRLKRLLDEWRKRSETARALGLAAANLAPPSVAGSQVLIVEDAADAAEFIGAALGQDGIATSLAGSEAETLAAVGCTGFDLIVLSLSLSGEDPLRLASRLRAAEATQDVPLLLLADAAHRDRLLRGADLGANDWLLRPLDPNELRARARNQIRRKIYQDRLRMDLGQALEAALIDPLTGLHNRRHMLRHLEGLLVGPGGMPVAVMMIDIDHFKAINDKYGHAEGDLALREVAELLRTRVRVFDSVARFGGEEFVVAMPGTRADEAMAAAERLRQAIAAHQVGRHALNITVSIGVARGAPSTAPADLLHEADMALYEAKRSGRNRVVLADAAVEG
jgi:two-component system cell cycle response regulator